MIRKSLVAFGAIGKLEIPNNCCAQFDACYKDSWSECRSMNLSESDDFSSAPFGSFKEKGLKLRLPMTLWLWQLLLCFLETTLPETNLATENWFRENSLFQGLIGNCKVNTPCFSHTKFLSVYPSENNKNNKFCQKKTIHSGQLTIS